MEVLSGLHNEDVDAGNKVCRCTKEEEHDARERTTPYVRDP